MKTDLEPFSGFHFLTILPAQLSQFLNPQCLVRKNLLFNSSETYVQRSPSMLSLL